MAQSRSPPIQCSFRFRVLTFAERAKIIINKELSGSLPTGWTEQHYRAIRRFSWLAIELSWGASVEAQKALCNQTIIHRQDGWVIDQVLLPEEFEYDNVQFDGRVRLVDYKSKHRSYGYVQTLPDHLASPSPRHRLLLFLLVKSNFLGFLDNPFSRSTISCLLPRGRGLFFLLTKNC
jgi:hypothetical protein